MGRTFIFIGVTTGQSAIMQIFPRWRDRLDLGSDVEIVGCDLPLDTTPERYREVVQALQDDPNTVGGLVTTHKLNLFSAAHDLFGHLDEYAELLHEVSCIGKHDGRLAGWATDPISAGRTLVDMLGEGYFGSTGGDTLCFGAGGAGHAIALYLMSRTHAGDQPRRLIMTDTSTARLESMRELHADLKSSVALECIQSGDPHRNDALVEDLPPGSLVINATGMGKDRPGSPLSDTVSFPERSVVWELNYRGSLDFMHQARGQRTSLQVRVEDGWQYFIYGWTTVIERVFGRPISSREVEMLGLEAAFARPRQDHSES